MTFTTGRSAGAATLAALLTWAPTCATAQITAYAYVANTDDGGGHA